MIPIFGYEYNDVGLEVQEGKLSLSARSKYETILLTLSGIVRLEVGREILNLSDNQIYIINEAREYRIVSTTDSTVLLMITVPKNLIINYSCKDQKLPEGLISSNKLKLLTLAKRIIASVDQQSGVQLKTIGISHEFIDLLYSQSNEASTPIYSLHREIEGFINENISEKVTLSSISEKFGYNPSYFSRYFKDHFGKNFSVYLTEIRLNRVKNQLVSTDKRINELAKENGFTSISGFNRLFKRQVGQSPTSYREMNQMAKSNEEVQSADTTFSSTVLNEIADWSDQVIITNQEAMLNLAPWKKLINIGSAQDLLQYDLRKHLNILVEKLEFEYVRFWNLFAKSMDINPDFTREYNFEKIDSLLDYICSIKSKPFIELSYKVKRVHRSTKETIIFDNSDYAFSSNDEEWYRFFERFMQHLLRRYGLKKISTWKLEMTFDYNGNQKVLTELINRYKGTYDIVKKYAPEMEMGGPGAKGQIQGEYNYQKDLKKMYAQNLQFDFLSYMLYPYYEGGEGAKRAKRLDDTDFLTDNIERIRKGIEDSGYGNKPLYISEWSNTISNRNEINDGLYKATYLVKNLMEVCNEVEGLGYWVGSDLFGEFLDSKNLLHGGTGLIAKRSIIKPAFRGIELLNLLDEKVSYRDNNCIVTISEEETYHCLMHNYKPLNDNYLIFEENKVSYEEINQFFSDQLEKEIEIKLKPTAGTQFEIMELRMSPNRKNIIDKWQDLGFRNSLNNDQIEYISQGSKPLLNYRTLSLSQQKELVIRNKLYPNEILFFQVKQIKYSSI